MKIPRDLKPGDRLWYSKTGYATVANRIGRRTFKWVNGSINAKHGNGKSMFYMQDGTEEWGDTPPIIRIERIASAPAKVKRAKVDADGAWLKNLDYEEDSSHRKCVRFTKAQWSRIRAIARRLEGDSRD